MEQKNDYQVPQQELCMVATTWRCSRVRTKGSEADPTARPYLSPNDFIIHEDRYKVAVIPSVLLRGVLATACPPFNALAKFPINQMSRFHVPCLTRNRDSLSDSSQTRGNNRRDLSWTATVTMVTASYSSCSQIGKLSRWRLFWEQDNKPFAEWMQTAIEDSSCCGRLPVSTPTRLREYKLVELVILQ